MLQGSARLASSWLPASRLREPSCQGVDIPEYLLQSSANILGVGRCPCITMDVGRGSQARRELLLQEQGSGVDGGDGAVQPETAPQHWAYRTPSS